MKWIIFLALLIGCTKPIPHQPQPVTREIDFAKIKTVTDLVLILKTWTGGVLLFSYLPQSEQDKKRYEEIKGLLKE